MSARNGRQVTWLEQPMGGWPTPRASQREDWIAEDADDRRAAAEPPTEHAPAEDEYR